MDARISEIQRALADEEGPSVFHEIDNTFFTAGRGSFIGDLYDILGAENIANATGEAYPQMTQEAIIEADPDVIILADEDAGETPATVAARPGWEAISAVQNNRVHIVDPDIVSRPGPRIVVALRTLARFLYSD
jgi:iron complex transport system substrate-binding protein